MTRPRRRPPVGPPALAVLVLLLLAMSLTGAVPDRAAAGAPGPAAARSAARGPGPCRVPSALTIAKDSRARLFVVLGPEEDIYGQETRIYGCWHRARPRRLETLESGDEASFLGARFAARYVGYATDHFNTMCGKALGADPLCTSSRLRSFDLRTGRERAAVDLDARPARFALGTRGWIAWVTEPDAHGVREVHAAARGAARLLDRGAAIEPDSIRVRGDDASWRRDGVRRSAPIR